MEDTPQHSKLILPLKPSLVPRKAQYQSTIFTPATFISNQYKVALNKNLVIYQYQVNLSPPPVLDSRNIYRLAINVSNLESQLGEFSYQGQSIYSTQKLKDYSQEVSIVLDKNGTTNKLDMEVLLVKEIPMDDIGNFDCATGNTVTQILNTFFKNKMKDLNFVEIGQNAKYYDPNSKHVINDDLSFIRGFSLNSKICQNNSLQVTVDPICKIIRHETALDFIENCKQMNYRQYEKMVKGSNALSLVGKKTMYRISGVETKMTPLSKMPGSDMTFAQYYLKNYNVKISQPKQPLVYSMQKNQKMVYLVPELLQMSGLTDRMKNTRQIMDQIAQFTRIEPQKKMDMITKFMSQFCNIKKEETALEDISNKPVQARGYKIIQPKLFIDNNASITPGMNGTFQLKNVKYQSKIELKDWIFVHLKSDTASADMIFGKLKQAAESFGLQISEPGFISVDLPPKQQGNFKQWKYDIMKDIKKWGNPQMVFTLLQKKNNESQKLYSSFKKLFLNELKVQHQNCLIQTFRNDKQSLSIASKLILQMFAKLGVELWQTEIPKSLPKHTMLVGVDVYHKTIKYKNSIAALVSTCNKEFTKFFSKTDIHPPGQELLPNFGRMLQQSLESYNDQNQCYPENIIVLRDGVGDGQIHELLNFETKQIEDTFKKIRFDYNPKVAEVLISKRISNRFFQNQTNPNSGSIITDDVVSMQNFEFFMIAQSVTQGTCTPTKYQVIHNTTDITQDQFAQLIYWQTFNYYNWCGAVRVPSVAQYAHKLAYLVGESMQMDVKIEQGLSFL